MTGKSLRDELRVLTETWRAVEDDGHAHDPAVAFAQGILHENELRVFGSQGKAWAGLGNAQQPTHWMPLPSSPEIPKAERQEKA